MVIPNMSGIKLSKKSMEECKKLEEVIEKIECHLKWLKTVKTPNEDLIKGIEGIQKVLEGLYEKHHKMTK